jgi:glycosyltransferase involved in cell wall biosynthesis
MGADDHRIAMIPNFLDSMFSRENKVEPAFDNDRDRQLLYVGRLEYVKNLLDPIRAIDLLPDKYKLQIIGDGSLEKEIRRTITNMGVSNRVTLHGHVANDRLTLYYEDADVFIHPIRGVYTFSRTCLEAISANLPIICTATGDTHEMLPNSSVTYSEGDPADLARTIENLLRDSDKLAHLYEGCLDDVNQYTRDETIQKIEHEYNAVTAQ